MKAYAFHPEADQEYARAAEFYVHIDPDLAKRFYEEIERLILNIRNDPDRFPMFDPPLRRHFSPVLPYAIVFLDQPDHVLILAVMHMRRRPGYWRDRL